MNFQKMNVPLHKISFKVKQKQEFDIDLSNLHRFKRHEMKSQFNLVNMKDKQK